MEAVIIKHDFTSGPALEKSVSSFFSKNSLDSAKVLFWTFFQCWVTRDCKLKADLSDEEIAIFFDQLLELLEAVHQAHERKESNA